MRTAGYQAQKEYSFVSGAYPADTFLVARFTGTEGISRLYEFDITLASEDPEIDSRAMLQNPATFTITAGDAEIPVHGMLAGFEQLQEIDETVFYRAKLVPRLWQTSLYHENQLFLDKSVPDIIEEILNQAGLTSNDYDLRLTGTYDPWEYICQFRETDFNFISRWMEREGIYYYFEQADGIDKVIITDSSTSHEDVSGETAIPYLPPSGQVPAEEDCVHVFTCRQQVLPAKVMLKDYNYRRPTLDLKGEADVDADGGRGTVYIYGEHFKTPEAGNALAAIRAGEFLCREQLFYGESTAANLCPGFLFELTDHYRDSYNQRYLVTELTHEGKTARFLFEGERSPQAAEAGGMGYTNRFTLIPADVQFRPERLSTKPRFYGSMNATVDSAGDGQYAEIDDEGRYKVILPFDQSGNTGGKASRWIRMAQPYAGANYGMHFPLHKGTEVLLTFVDGDPDRPIIAGSVPNPDTMSPVTGGNQTQSIIRTGGDNQIRLEDADGGQLIRMDSPTSNSHFRIGAAENNPNGFSLESNDNYSCNLGGASRSVIGDQYSEDITGPMSTVCHNDQENMVDGNINEESTDRSVTTRGNENRRTQGNRSDWIDGTETKKVYGATDETFLGAKTSKKLSVENEMVAGAKITNKLSAEFEMVYGLKMAGFAGKKIEKAGTLRLKEAPADTTKATARITLQCGGSKITIAPGGIAIKAPKLIINAKTIVRKDSEFRENVDIKGDTTVDGNHEVEGFLSNPNFCSPP